MDTDKHKIRKDKNQIYINKSSEFICVNLWLKILKNL